MTRWQTFLLGVVLGALAVLASLLGVAQSWWQRHGL